MTSEREATSGSPAQSTIGVALSGGGHRAALFSLGALMYLVESGLNTNVAAITSVSGASITNAYVASAMDFREPVSRDELQKVIRPLFDHIVARARFGVATWGIGLLVTGAMAAALVLLSKPWWFAVAGLLLYLLSFQAVARAMFASDLKRLIPKPVRQLGDLPSSGVEHVFCATDLADAKHFHFSRSFLYSDRLKRGSPDVGLITAVRASAAFPAVFAPVRLRTRNLGFRDAPSTRLHLVDGGVHDNLGTSWLLEWNGRRSEEGFRDNSTIREMIVINSSSQRFGGRRGWTRFPIVSRFADFARSMSAIQQSNSVARAREELLFGASIPRGGLRGVMISIDSTPFDAAKALIFEGLPEESSEAKAVARAAHALDLLRDYPWSEHDWLNIVGNEVKAWIPTSLSRVEAYKAARVVFHAYVLTMAACHVSLGYPMDAIPAFSEFRSQLADSP